VPTPAPAMEGRRRYPIFRISPRPRSERKLRQRDGTGKKGFGAWLGLRDRFAPPNWDGKGSEKASVLTEGTGFSRSFGPGPINQLCRVTSGRGGT